MLCPSQACPLSLEAPVALATLAQGSEIDGGCLGRACTPRHGGSL